MAKGNNARDKIMKERHKELACKYRAHSYSFREIAEMISNETGVKITHVTAFNDYIGALEEAKKQVENTAIFSLVSQLEKLDRLEHQYWRAWEKSIGKTSKKKIKKDSKSQKENMIQEAEEAEEAEQNGDVSFLNGIKSCIELRCKMMGYLTSNIDIKSNGKELQAITGMIVT